MRDLLSAVVVAAIFLPFAIGIQYLLALAGEPRAVWLMCTILGWCNG